MNAVVRFAHLIEEVNGRTPDLRGIRDEESPCDGFDPVPGARPFAHVREQNLIGKSDCETDGHYMCVECRNISVEALRRREGRCEECGDPLAFGPHERHEPLTCINLDCAAFDPCVTSFDRDAIFFPAKKPR